MLAVTVEQHAPHLLEGVIPDEIISEPYAHHARQNAVPEDIYRQLEAEFPNLDMILNGRSEFGNNIAVRLTVKQVLGDRRISPLWREFFEYHTSGEYWQHVTRLFGGHLRREFPDLEERVGRPIEDWRVVPRGFGGDADIRLDCQFVMNTPVTHVTSVKTPHVDLCDKVFSALFYFRDPLDKIPGGDFDIYRWRREPRFIKHRSMDCDVELVKTFKPSTVFLGHHDGPGTMQWASNYPPAYAIRAASPQTRTLDVLYRTPVCFNTATKDLIIGW